MNARINNSQAEAIGVPEPADPLLTARSRLALTRRGAQAIASVGRAGVIWLPVYALLAGEFDSLPNLLLVSIIVTIFWLLALRAAFAAARLTLLALGPAVAAALGTAMGFVAASALTLWIPALRVSPMRMLVIAGSVFVLSAAWEALVYRSIASDRRVLVVGTAGGGAELVQQLALESYSPFEIVGVVDDRDSDRVAGVPVLGAIDDLATVIDSERPDLVVLAAAERHREAFDHLLDAAAAGFKVVGLAQFYEHAFGRVPIRHVSATWFMSVLHLYQRPYSRLAKRTFDVVVAATGLILTAPLVPFIYLLVRRTPGPVIYRQTRLGEAGRHYTMFKFRTMVADAEAGGARFASEQDPRITGVGRFLRQTRLDELPQLWNVLRGDMSIVGPRPERPEFYDHLDETVPFWSRRHLVKPGVTGWAQVRSSYAWDAESTSEKLQYDLWYLRHRSLFLDLAICIKTFSTLLSGAGAR